MIIASLFLFAVAVLLFVVVPLWLLVGGIVRLAGRKGGAVRTVVGGVWALAAAAAILFVADSFDSRHERILDRGFTPDTPIHRPPRPNRFYPIVGEMDRSTSPTAFLSTSPRRAPPRKKRTQRAQKPQSQILTRSPRSSRRIEIVPSVH